MPAQGWCSAWQPQRFAIRSSSRPVIVAAAAVAPSSHSPPGRSGHPEHPCGLRPTRGSSLAADSHAPLSMRPRVMLISALMPMSEGSAQRASGATADMPGAAR